MAVFWPPHDLLHDLSLFYALQKYFLKSSAIAPLAVSVESCVQLQLWRENEQFNGNLPVTTHARYAAGRGRRARARAVYIVHMHIRADHVIRSIS